MKAFKHLSKQPSSKAGPVDLDVTPVMNMFVILIPFLVSMAVFTHYSVLEFGLPPNAGVGGGGPQKKDLKLTVVMGSFRFNLTLGDSLINTIELEGRSEDYNPLLEALEEVRKNLARKNEVVVAVNDGVKFEKVVRVMDICKDAGYKKIALAEGPNSQNQD